jgi:hypothetical protein
MSSHDDLEEVRRRALDDPDIPDGLRRALAAGLALETIHLDARGRWSHEGERFVNRRLSALFHRSVVCTSAGTWLLSIPPYTYPITVEDCGWFVVRVHSDAATDGLHAELAGGELVRLPTGGWWTDGGERVLVQLADGRRCRLVDDAWRWVGTALDGGEPAWVLRTGLTWDVHPLLSTGHDPGAVLGSE